MNSCDQRNLGESGLSYVREQLSDAGMFTEGLARYLAQGYAWEFVPEEQRQHFLEISDLHVGGIGEAASAEVLGDYIEFLCRVLEKDPGSVVLFENQLLRIGDPVLVGKSHIFQWMNATYSYLQVGSSSISESVIASHLRSASRYPSIVLVTRYPEQLYAKEARELTTEEASILERNLQHILVGAHDEEAYVAWSRLT